MIGDRQRTIVCDVSAIDADIGSVETLARLQLAAQRLGVRLRLQRASPDLRELITLAGLSEALGVEPCGQAEHREQPRGVEEEGELGDPAA